MIVLNAPVDFLRKDELLADIWIHEYQTSNNSQRNKIELSRNVLSMLLEGKKQLHIKNNTIEMDNRNIILIASGNCLMKELIAGDPRYRSLLLFFSNQSIENVLLEAGINPSIYLNRTKVLPPFYLIKKDIHLQALISRFSSVAHEGHLSDLKVIFIETINYLIKREGDAFISFLCTLIYSVDDSIFKRVIESHKFSTLSLEELSFLCNMSLSSFKRHFILKYGESPGKWFLKNRMSKAKDMLERRVAKPSEIYTLFGYENLSNFSAAFKNVFGYSPSKIYSEKDMQ